MTEIRRFAIVRSAICHMKDLQSSRKLQNSGMTEPYIDKILYENCTIQDWKDSVDKAWHKEAEEEIDQLNGVPINRIDVPSEMELSVLPSISSLPIRRPPSEIKGKHLGKSRKRIPSAGEK